MKIICPVRHLDCPSRTWKVATFSVDIQSFTKAWAAKIDAFDAYVVVTPEYNHGPSGALKNAIDYVYREWNNHQNFSSFKPAGHHEKAVEAMLGQLIPWAHALKALRNGQVPQRLAA